MHPGGGLVVVGATGWLGGHLVREALRAGYRPQPVSREGASVASIPGVRLARLPDLLGPDTTVLNAAGATGGDEAALTAANVTFVGGLADACAQAGARLVSVGSSAEYGPPTTPLVREDHPEAPTSAYGRTKLEGTQVLRRLGVEGLRACVLRVFNLVGAGRVGADPVSDFAHAVRGLPDHGGVVTAYDASLVRDLMTVRWAAQVVVRLLALDDLPGVVNVCTGRGTSFGSLIEAMAAERGVPVRIDSTRPGGIARVVGDPGRLVGLLGAVEPEPIEVVARAALGQG